MRFGEGAAEIPYYLQRPTATPAPAAETPADTSWAPYDPYTALAPTGEVPYYLQAPARSLGDLLSEYKWWLIGGGVGVLLLTGGSVLGLSLRKRRRSRR